MPTYVYECGACKQTTEIFQSMNDAPKRKCPRCGKSKLVRRIGIGAGILFKGSGFYQTDYRSDSYKKGEAAEKPGSSSTEKSGDSEKKDASKVDGQASTPAKDDSKSKSAVDGTASKSDASSSHAKKSSSKRK